MDKLQEAINHMNSVLQPNEQLKTVLKAAQSYADLPAKIEALPFRSVMYDGVYIRRNDILNIIKEQQK